MTNIELPELAVARKFESITAGDSIFRCHLADFAGTDFNPGVGQAGRFTPLILPSGHAVPTLYAAENFDVAVYETIFRRESSPELIVPISTVRDICVSQIAVCRELLMVPLFTPELRRRKIDESELLSPCETRYIACRTLAAKIWRVNPKANGIVWRSRQDSASKAYLLFGDRCSDKDLLVQQTRSESIDENFTQQMMEVAQRAGINIA